MAVYVVQEMIMMWVVVLVACAQASARDNVCAHESAVAELGVDRHGFAADVACGGVFNDLSTTVYIQSPQIPNVSTALLLFVTHSQL